MTSISMCMFPFIGRPPVLKNTKKKDPKNGLQGLDCLMGDKEKNFKG